jgi:hypothetical protein
MIAARQIAFGGGKRKPYDAEVEYLESTGTQYIDTGVVPDLGFGIYVEFESLVAPATTGKTFKVFGSSRYRNGQWGGPLILTWAMTSGGQMSWFQTESVFYNPGIRGNTRMWVRIIGDEFTNSFGAKFSTPKRTLNNVFGTLYLLSVHTDINISDSASGRVFSCSIYNNAILVRDFIPVRFTNENGDTEGAMYDKVSGELFRNQGTGAFILGPDAVSANGGGGG